jgi:hypothetical protein
MKRIYRLWILLAVLILAPHATHAFVETSYHGVLAVPGRAYYVDSVNGNDSNSGLSPSQAFKTIAHLTSADAAKPINTWKLAANSVWHEQITVPRNNMTIEAYGTGTMPLLDASDPISSAAWTKTSGETYTYQITASPPLNNGATWVNVWENGAFLTYASSVAGVDATAGSYYVTSETSSPITLYVHPVGNTNPESDGNLYEYTNRQFGITGNGESSPAVTNTTVNGIWTRRNLHNDGSITLGRYSHLINSRASDGGKHNALVADGATVLNSKFDGAYYNSQATFMLVLYDYGSFVSKPSLFSGLTFSLPSVQVGSEAMGSHTDGTTNLAQLTINNSSATNLSSGISVANMLSLVINGGSYSASGTSVAAITTSAATTSVSNVSISLNGAARAIQDGSSIPSWNLTLANVSINASSTGAMAIYSGNANESFNIQGSTVTGPIGDVLYGNGSGTSVYARNNTLTAANNIYYLTSSSSTLNSDYNTFSSSSLTNLINGTTYTTIPTIRYYLGQELHSTPANAGQLLSGTSPTDQTQAQWSENGLTRTAASITENGQTFQHNNFNHVALTANGLYTNYMEVKPNGRTWVALTADNGANGAYFDVQNCLVGNTIGTIVNSGATELDNGYCGISISSLVSSNHTQNGIDVNLATGNGAALSYTGNSSSGVYVRFAEIAEGGTPVPSGM